MSIIKTEVSIEEYNLNESEAAWIKASFVPIIEETKEFDQEYIDIISLSEKEITVELSERAWELRKKLLKKRTSTKEIHQKEKAYYLNWGRFVDALKNCIYWAIEQAEDNLEWIEKYFINLKKIQIEDLHNQRVKSLIEFWYIDNWFKFWEMEIETWKTFYLWMKEWFEAKQVQEAKDKKDKEEAAEKERQRVATLEKENAALKKENKVIAKDLKKAEVIVEKAVQQNVEVTKKMEVLEKSVPELISAIEALEFTCSKWNLRLCSHWQKLKSLIS